MKKRLLLLTFAFCLLTLAQAQNVGIGTTKPVNKLQVVGNLLVNEPLTQTVTPPTAGQTQTLVNGSSQYFSSVDSTGRIYDPGGPSNNYLDNLQGTTQIVAEYSSSGISFAIEDIDLAPGDSLIIRDIANNPAVTFFAFGNSNQATGNFIINSYEATITFKSNTDGMTGRGFALLFKRLFSVANQPSASGYAGKAFYFDASKGTLRAGTIAPGETPGCNSVAIGDGNLATGQNSVAFGIRSKATGFMSVAMGYDNTASGFYSTAFGTSNVASGSNATVFGSGTVADGTNATAIGSYTSATSSSSFAAGSSSIASGYVSTAIGYGTYANGNYAVALGESSTASGEVSTAMGFNTTASGYSATAMGKYTTASGSSSTAMGNYASTSNLTGAFAIGDNSTTTVMESFAANGFRARFAGGYRLFTTSAVTVGAFLNAGANSWAALSDRRMKENFLPIDGEAFLKKIAAMPLTTWNYIGQDVKTFRHYGPMAQDFFAAFGKDKLGVIGCDTLINQQDFLGVSFIAIQALEKRTRQLTMDNARLADGQGQLTMKIGELKMQNENLEARLQKLEALENLNAKLEMKNEELEARLRKLEDLLKKSYP